MFPLERKNRTNLAKMTKQFLISRLCTRNFTLRRKYVYINDSIVERHFNGILGDYSTAASFEKLFNSKDAGSTFFLFQFLSFSFFLSLLVFFRLFPILFLSFVHSFIFSLAFEVFCVWVCMFRFPTTFPTYKHTYGQARARTRTTERLCRTKTPNRLLKCILRALMCECGMQR